MVSGGHSTLKSVGTHEWSPDHGGEQRFDSAKDPGVAAVVPDMAVLPYLRLRVDGRIGILGWLL